MQIKPLTPDEQAATAGLNINRLIEVLETCSFGRMTDTGYVTASIDPYLASLVIRDLLTGDIDEPTRAAPRRRIGR